MLECQMPYTVSAALIETFKHDGVVVLPDVFTATEVEDAQHGLADTLLRYGVVRVTSDGIIIVHFINLSPFEQDIQNLQETAGHLRSLSSTHGSGGVIDLYYPKWKLKLAESSRFFSAISQLWAATYGRHDSEIVDQEENELWSHPYGHFDPTRGYFYLDRTGFRVPDPISKLHAKGRRPLQRSLTPHLDCCPSTLYTTTRTQPRWRPIQSIIALTDNLSPNLGGFECARGFHRHFRAWAKTRRPCTNGASPPCIGDFTPIRPVEDQGVIDQFNWVKYGAGDVICFDWRCDYKSQARWSSCPNPPSPFFRPSLAVVEYPTQMQLITVETHQEWYPMQAFSLMLKSIGGKLPSTLRMMACFTEVLAVRPLPFRFAKRGRDRWQKMLKPDDQWLGENKVEHETGELYDFSALGRQLMGFGLD